jgi:hypothetical protein
MFLHSGPIWQRGQRQQWLLARHFDELSPPFRETADSPLEPVHCMPAGKLEIPPAASKSEVLAALYDKHRAVLPSDAGDLQLAFQVGRQHALSPKNALLSACNTRGLPAHTASSGHTRYSCKSSTLYPIIA